MYSILVKRALVAAFFIGPIAACVNGPQDFSHTAKNGSECKSSANQRSTMQAHYTEKPLDRESENSPPMIETIFCGIFTA